MSHFNKEAANWDDPKKIHRMNTLAKETLKVLNLSKKIDILDFGCGTGLFGLEFSEFANTLTGIDTSEGMLKIFDEKTKGYDHIKSLNVDLEKKDVNLKFDLIVTSMAFHHLTNPAQMLSKFKSMLNPNGMIAVVDLSKEDGTFHPNNKEMGVKHFGFSKEAVIKWANSLSLSLNYSTIFEIAKNEKNYKLFLAVFKSKD